VDRLTIGELAQASGLSPATIRRYGAAGVLAPAQVDPCSGYRFYTADQVETAVLARTLRLLEVPLYEVREILAEVPRLAQHSLAAMTERARREGRNVLGDPVLRYGWPPERHAVDSAAAPREVEVCLPVDGEGDVLLCCPAGPPRSPRSVVKARTSRNCCRRTARCLSGLATIGTGCWDRRSSGAGARNTSRWAG
jgi:DNA-binding transcriptional MerR regulator